MYKIRKILNIFFIFFICVVVSFGDIGVVQAAPKMDVEYEGFELDGNKLYLLVTIRNNTFNQKKKSTQPQKMVLQSLKGKVKVEINGEKIINRKQLWYLNECAMPEKTFRLFVDEIDPAKLETVARNGLKVSFDPGSRVSVVDKNMVHSAVTDWKWDEEKSALRIVLDICNDHYYDVKISGMDIAFDSSDEDGLQSQSFNGMDFDVVIPRYTQQKMVVYIPMVTPPPKIKGNFEVKRIYRQFIVKHRQTVYSDGGDDETYEEYYEKADTPENAYEYESYDYSEEDTVVEGKDVKPDGASGIDSSSDEAVVVFQTPPDDAIEITF